MTIFKTYHNYNVGSKIKFTHNFRSLKQFSQVVLLLVCVLFIYIIIYKYRIYLLKITSLKKFYKL